MKKLKALLTASVLSLTTLFSSALHAPVLQASSADPVRIMPIGDSITFGYGETGGYRKYLDYALKEKGIEFDMVGPEGKDSESFVYNGTTCQYDGNHAGYSGFTIKQQYPIPSWGENGLLEKLQSKDAVKNAQPDIVLLIIGTNDMTANRDLSACEEDLHTLVDYILGDMPEGGVIFMGSIPEFTAYGGNSTRVGNYNQTVQKVAESYGDNVQFADVHGCLNGMADIDTADNLHPNGGGYEKMGRFWADVIEEQLGGSGVDPDDPVILRSDFESGISGWKSRGAASVSAASDQASEGNSSASVTGRTASWNGIAYTLSSKRCPAGTQISVRAKVRQDSGETVHFKMTMQYDGSDGAVYDTFAEADAEPGSWVTLSCPDYTVKEGSNLILYFETDTELCDFWLDDVLVMKSDGTFPEDTPGDVNGDGEFNASDAVVLQRWLLAVPGTELKNWQAGDLCADERLDIFDMIAMRQLLAEK
ncbi:MAG: carbohydrate binding domain-containing protein [Ruminococcus sp.]|nr:carbohydrate binding domain-containing protein [Ruminococcus sp.]